jgi:cardiolipin synthase
LNDEVDAVVLGSETADEMEAMFQDDERGAKPVDLAAGKNHPLFQRLEESFVSTSENML